VGVLVTVLTPPLITVFAMATMCFGLLVGVPTGFWYHVALYRVVSPKVQLPRTWWIAPSELHRHLTDAERRPIYRWYRLGAVVFVLLAGVVWATLFGLVRKKDLRNPEGRVLPLSAAGFLLGAAAMWIYIFAGVSYALERLDFVEFAASRPNDLLYQLTDAYGWYFLDLLPG